MVPPEPPSHPPLYDCGAPCTVPQCSIAINAPPQLYGRRFIPWLVLETSTSQTLVRKLFPWPLTIHQTIAFFYQTQPRRLGMHSDIHVAVRFHDQSVFAGEQLRCTITFRNVANVTEEPVTPSSFQNRRRSRRESISQLAAQANRPNNVLRLSQNGRSFNNGHSPDPGGQRRSPSISSTAHGSTGDSRSQRPGHKHQRSVSIISVNSPTVTGDVGGWDKPKRPGHSRSSTVQLHHGRCSNVSQNTSNHRLMSDSTSTREQPARPTPFTKQSTTATHGRPSEPVIASRQRESRLKRRLQITKLERSLRHTSSR